MKIPLATYLHDHLSGATFAIELLKSLRDQHSGEPLGQVSAELLAEVEQDRELLLRIVEQVGGDPPALKEAAAWLTEKLSRFKLGRDAGQDLGTFEVLEMLTLGILGKLALWRVLIVVGEFDARVRGEDYNQLAARAESQHARVEERRLQAARKAFGLPPH